MYYITEKKVFFITLVLLTLIVGYKQLMLGQTHVHSDAIWTYDVCRSIIDDFDLDLKNQIGAANLENSFSQISLGKNGEWFSVHEPLIAMLSAPFVSLFGAIGMLIVNLLLQATIVSLFFILISTETKKILTEKGSNWACILSLLILSQPSFYRLFNYVSIDYFPPIGLLGSLIYVKKERYLLAGIFLGFICFGRFTGVLAIPFLALYLLPKLAHFFWFALGALIGIIPIFIFNFLSFGNIFSTSYGNWCNGALNVATQADLIQYSFKALFNFLFDIQFGIFISAPFAAISLVLSVLFFNKIKQDWALMLYALVAIVVFSGFSQELRFGGARYVLSSTILIYYIVIKALFEDYIEA